MVEVTTKEQLESALQNKEKKIIVKGELANKINKKKKIKTGAKILGGTLIVAGIALAPFTGGASLAVSGFTVTTAAGTAVALTTGEIAILAGITAGVGALGISIALLKGYTVKRDKDGSITLSLKD